MECMADWYVFSALSGVSFIRIVSEWQEDRPPAPSYLRIVYLGKMLQDDENLTSGFQISSALLVAKHAFSELRILPSLPAAPQPTIAHLLIRPYGSCEVDGAVKKKRKTDDGVLSFLSDLNNVRYMIVFSSGWIVRCRPSSRLLSLHHLLGPTLSSSSHTVRPLELSLNLHDLIKNLKCLAAVTSSPLKH